MIKITVAASLFLMGLTLFSSCNSDAKKPEEKAKYVISDSLFKTLRIDTVSECPVVNSLTLTGQVAFNDSKVARIFPMVSGIISAVIVQVGDHVAKGQKLGVIRSSEMAGYGNDLVNSKTNLLIAKKNMDAAEDMYKSGLMSQKDYLTTQQLYTQAQSQLQRSNEVLQINGGSTQGDYVVRAPISGFIVEKTINNNMTIRTDNANDLFTISDLENVWVWANVYESNISKVHLGDNVDVTTLSYPGKVFKGKVDQILNVLDPTNKVMKIRVVLPNPGYALKPQMFASVTVINKTNEQALCVPSNALTFNNSQYYILVYKSKSDVRITPVHVISTNADKSYITGEIKQGNIIIGSDVVLIYDELNN